MAETLDEQSGAGEQRERESGLQYHERLPRQRRAIPRRARVAQCIAGIRLRGHPSGSSGKNDAGEKRNGKSECEHGDRGIRINRDKISAAKSDEENRARAVEGEK